MTDKPTDDPKVIRMKPKKAKPGGWQDHLMLNDRGVPKACLANAIAALRWAPEWDGVLWHDEFGLRTVARRRPPWVLPSIAEYEEKWTDCDNIRLAEWLQRQGINVNPTVAGQAVEVVSRNWPFHPVREYLESLEWDGVPRLTYWLNTYLGVPKSPYAAAVGPRWMISAVARIYRPGCKVDTCLILEGPQNLKKSMTLAVLGGSWFTDQVSDLGTKDSCIDVQGYWIAELAELDSMNRSEVGTIKAFMSRQVDRYRPPYGRLTVEQPRQCVFAGTVNPEGAGYLKDVTGGRRFWPVACTDIDMDALKRDRDQLWAEAAALYHDGFPWWLDTQELERAAESQQRNRYIGDAWEEPISEYLTDRTDTSLSEILQYALVLEKGQWNQVNQNRAVRVLTSIGWEQYRKRIDKYTVVRRYRRASTEDRSQQEPQKPQNSATFANDDVNGKEDRTQECSRENPSVSGDVNGVNSVNSKSTTYTHPHTHMIVGNDPSPRTHRSQSTQAIDTEGNLRERPSVHGSVDPAHCAHPVPADDLEALLDGEPF